MVILASASPRRQDLLRNAGIPFCALPVNIDESRRPQESAVELCRRLALQKAEAAINLMRSRPLDWDERTIPVVAADTIVVLPDRQTKAELVLGKPSGTGDARQMLQALAGRSHRVLTGVCVSWLSPSGRKVEVAAETTLVHMRPIPESEIDDYIATGEPMDKAGAYAIQGRASRWIYGIEGCYSNVVGLPIARLWEMLGASVCRCDSPG